MRISDWSSDVCSSDLVPRFCLPVGPVAGRSSIEAEASGCQQSTSAITVLTLWLPIPFMMNGIILIPRCFLSSFRYIPQCGIVFHYSCPQRPRGGMLIDYAERKTESSKKIGRAVGRERVGKKV